MKKEKNKIGQELQSITDVLFELAIRVERTRLRVESLQTVEPEKVVVPVTEPEPEPEKASESKPPPDDKIGEETGRQAIKIMRPDGRIPIEEMLNIVAEHVKEDGGSGPQRTKAYLLSLGFKRSAGCCSKYLSDLEKKGRIYRSRRGWYKPYPMSIAKDKP